MGFGYPIPKNAVIGWGARAIFKPMQTQRLDLLWDRQSVCNPGDDKGKVEVFCQYLNKVVLPVLNGLSAYFNTNDRGRFVKHFDAASLPGVAPGQILVAMGSPNGSYGYFYLCAFLIDAGKAPAEELPSGLVWEREYQLRKQAEQKFKKLARTNPPRRRNPPAAPPQTHGDIVVQIGATFTEWINQQWRECRIVEVKRSRFRIEFAMPTTIQRGWRQMTEGKYTPARPVGVPA